MSAYLKRTKANPHSIYARSYVIRQAADSVMEVDVSFIVPVIGGAGAADISKWLERLGLWFADGGISIVKGTEKPRCFYCAQLNEMDALECRKCGAPL